MRTKRTMSSRTMRCNGGLPHGSDLDRAESLHGSRVSRFARAMHTTQEEAVPMTHGTKTGAVPMSLIELPFGFPGRVFRSPFDVCAEPAKCEAE